MLSVVIQYFIKLHTKLFFFANPFTSLLQSTQYTRESTIRFLQHWSRQRRNLHQINYKTTIMRLSLLKNQFYWSFFFIFVHRGVAVDDQGFIIVADSGNNRIQIFTAGKTKLKRKINRHIIYKICYKIIIVIFKTDGGFVTSFGMTHTKKNFQNG